MAGATTCTLFPLVVSPRFLFRHFLAIKSDEKRPLSAADLTTYSVSTMVLDGVRKVNVDAFFVLFVLVVRSIPSLAAVRHCTQLQI